MCVYACVGFDNQLWSIGCMGKPKIVVCQAYAYQWAVFFFLFFK